MAVVLRERWQTKGITAAVTVSLHAKLITSVSNSTGRSSIVVFLGGAWTTIDRVRFVSCPLESRSTLRHYSSPRMNVSSPLQQLSSKWRRGFEESKKAGRVLGSESQERNVGEGTSWSQAQGLESFVTPFLYFTRTNSPQAFMIGTTGTADAVLLLIVRLTPKVVVTWTVDAHLHYVSILITNVTKNMSVSSKG